MLAFIKNYLVKKAGLASALIYFAYFFFACIFYVPNVNTVSIVYHFRISQITKQPIFEHIDTNYMAIALFFDEVLKRYTGSLLKNFAGNLDAFIYNFKPYYLRGDFAFAYVLETIKSKLEFSGIETDDILFTIGRNYIIDGKAKITVSGLFGTPTHKNRYLQHAQLAYAQVGIGAQLDGTYKFDNKNTFIWGLRSLYFIPRSALDVEKRKHIFTIGTLSDILIAWKYDWGFHDIEIGFTERFQLGARIRPSLDNILQRTNYIRNSFYLAYKYKFLIGDIHNRITYDIAYSFDNTPKKYGFHVFISWITWNVSF